MSEWLSSGTTSSEVRASNLVGSKNRRSFHYWTCSRQWQLDNIIVWSDYWAHQRMQRSVVLLTIPHAPVKTALSMSCIEVSTFYLWSFFSTSHSSELWVEFFWVQFLFVHLWQSKSRHGGEECRAHENNFYGYGGHVLNIWYLKPTKVHIVISI